MFERLTGVSSAARNKECGDFQECGGGCNSSHIRHGVGELGISENWEMGSITLFLGVFKYFSLVGLSGRLNSSKTSPKRSFIH